MFDFLKRPVETFQEFLFLSGRAFRNIFPTGDGTYAVALAKGRYSARIYLGRDGKILGLIFNPR